MTNSVPLQSLSVGTIPPGFSTSRTIAEALPSKGCAALKTKFPSKVFYPGSPVYEYESHQYRSNIEPMSPGCIFRPMTSLDVSEAVLVNRDTNTQFAVRGGGHMGSNNIHNGVLVVLSNLTTLELCNDGNTLSLGPGFTWGRVYSYLEKYDLAAAGGRLSSIEVPDLLLAGGGGSSNFGIVTKFKLRTFKSTKVWAGMYTVSGEHLDQFSPAFANYSAFNTDPLSHVPMVVAATETSTVAAVILFYDSDTVSSPVSFAPFFALSSIANSCVFKTLSHFAIETAGLVVPSISNLFIAGTTTGKIFFDPFPSLFAHVPFSNFSLISIDRQPIGSSWTAGSKAVNPVGNALGLDTAMVEWFGSEYDAFIYSGVQNMTAAINAATQKARLFDVFNCMGDAAGFQAIYSGYGAANKAKLPSISRKYDPDGVYQNLMPGGFKIGV
ncbi:hypothetical protein BCR34DRAFT_623728 [Clohesyomyces aquaticus]|uniref:FAD linked oxidase N-terminal domain-containing protein n=1 Tax=Clohesyomyces aquaticus TaxID=1231657 RepID=A0A1Y1ZTL7_9PLEO|nr:hypothetical protein BCR34DRAFT_623728 [Clohesyomyces aquaticus]